MTESSRAFAPYKALKLQGMEADSHLQPEIVCFLNQQSHTMKCDKPHNGGFRVKD